jgi:cyclic dehypoxanthinyl futalosine synthase
MIETIRKKIDSSEHITRSEALYLLNDADLLALGKLADVIRSGLHPGKDVSFVVDRNVNYTNVCEVKCKFCAFYRDGSAPDAYVLSREEIFGKIDELVEQGGTCLMQGGLHPDLGIDYFEDLSGDQDAFSCGLEPFPVAARNYP